MDTIKLDLGDGSTVEVTNEQVVAWYREDRAKESQSLDETGRPVAAEAATDAEED